MHFKAKGGNIQLVVFSLYCLFVLLPLQSFVVLYSQPGSGLYPTRVRGFLITNNDAPQSVGFLWTGDQSIAETST
jgi:hypothetical protein